MFADLELRMVALGFATGIVFPFFVMALGVDPAQALTVWFFGATVAAGLMIGGVNFLLCRLVVGERVRRLSVRMRMVGDTIETATALGDWPGFEAERCSSLSYLKRLPVQELKIDRAFVTNMDTSHDDAVIVRSTIDLARNLGLRVVAEGVESQRALDQLADAGCDLAHGYPLSPPLAAAELNAWLEDRVSAGLWVPARLSRAGSA